VDVENGCDKKSNSEILREKLDRKKSSKKINVCAVLKIKCLKLHATNKIIHAKNARYQCRIDVSH